MTRRDALRLAAGPLVGLALGGRPGFVLAQDDGDAAAVRRWWKEAVVYQVYPRSFMDSNGDGIGDLPGLLTRLDYLAALGVDIVWLCPHYASPNVDNGYDISDYRQVNPQFGTMADFDALVAGLKARGMRLIVDLVVNHTSDRHEWFQRSRSARDSPYRDYHIWRDAKPDGAVPNNYTSMFGGPTWTLDETTGQYYLHLFASQQPDLNWENPSVRAAVHDVMRFWLDRGVSGFRMDAITFISKRPGLPDMTPREREDVVAVYGNGPNRDDFIRDMRREVLSRYDTMTVGEAGGISPEQARDITDPRRGELDMLFTFEIGGLKRGKDEEAATLVPRMRRAIAERARLAEDGSWNASLLANHDLPRSVSHFGDADPRWRTASAKVLATLLLTQRATAFVYQGEELGMTNFPFASMDQFDDVFAKNEWRLDVVGGRVSASDRLDELRRTSRDNARTPMQWTAGPNGGFTTGRPWLQVNPNADQVNAETEAEDGSSVLNYYKRLIALREQHPVLVYGSYRDVEPDHPTVFGYARTLADVACVVLMNFSRAPIDYRLPAGLVPGAVLLSSRGDAQVLQTQDATSVRLAGWHGVILSAHRPS